MNRTMKPRRGLTLVELLVVIAIIGLLVSMVLPGLQSAREAARRAQCLNNFRQIGLALQAHCASQGTFPSGSTPTPAVGTPPTWSYGVAWPYRLLPFIEQLGLFSRLNPNTSSWNSANAATIANIEIPTFTCPTSPCPRFAGTEAWNPNGPVQVGSMVGIAGAVSAIDVKGRYDTSASASNNHAWNGVLHACSQVTPAHVRDGLSNVICVGETSDWGYNPAFPGGQFDCRGMFPHSWLMGSRRAAPQTPNADARVFNTTVINTRPLGTKVCSYGQYGTTAVAGMNFDNSVPIQSAHPGGAVLLFCDGAVQFVTDTLPLDILQTWAIRDSGQTKSWQQ
ncbi:MAG: DUF1559 domain-containing protein [Planctomycetia bacterium]|nr:DUF1559 domain-containing protein [Planctomycetia bacterium]